jgi:hypothetical protein
MGEGRDLARHALGFGAVATHAVEDVILLRAGDYGMGGEECRDERELQQWPRAQYRVGGQERRRDRGL